MMLFVFYLLRREREGDPETEDIIPASDLEDYSEPPTEEPHVAIEYTEAPTESTQSDGLQDGPIMVKYKAMRQSLKKASTERLPDVLTEFITELCESKPTVRSIHLIIIMNGLHGWHSLISYNAFVLGDCIVRAPMS